MVLFYGTWHVRYVADFRNKTKDSIEFYLLEAAYLFSAFCFSDHPFKSLVRFRWERLCTLPSLHQIRGAGLPEIIPIGIGEWRRLK